MRKRKDGTYLVSLKLYKMFYSIEFTKCDDFTDGVTFYDEKLQSNTVRLKFDDPSPNTIAHECVHAAMYTFARVGLPIDFEHDEALAYLVGWLVEQVNKALEKENAIKV